MKNDRHELNLAIDQAYQLAQEHKDQNPELYLKHYQRAQWLMELRGLRVIYSTLNAFHSGVEGLKPSPDGGLSVDCSCGYPNIPCPKHPSR